MDGSRFDSMARSLAAPGTRRRFVGGLAAGIVALIRAGRAEAARPGTLSIGAHCRKDANCKSGVCQLNPKLRTGASGRCAHPDCSQAVLAGSPGCAEVFDDQTFTVTL